MQKNQINPSMWKTQKESNKPPVLRENSDKPPVLGVQLFPPLDVDLP